MSFWQKLARFFENIVLPPHDDPAEAPNAIVIVRGGDSLWAISEELVGDGNRWTELAAANVIKNFDKDFTIFPKEELKVPCAWLDEMAAKEAAAT